LADKTAGAVQGAAEAAKKKFQETKDAFVKQANDQLSGFDKKVEELKAKIKDAPADSKAKLEEKAKTADDLLKQLKEHVAKVGDFTQDGWKAFEDKAKELIEKLKKALE
jgi:predicted phage tail protein